MTPIRQLRNLTVISLVAAVLGGGLSGCAVVAAGGAGAAVASDRRTTGTMVDDQAIELRVSNAIFRDDELKRQAHINVTAFNGVVLLTGETPTEPQRDRAVEAARHVDGVRRVHNEIFISPPTSVSSRAQDTWITTKVKSKLLANKQVKGTHVKVVTEYRVVYLMGLLTRAEADAAAEAARYVEKVERVVTLFEYLD